jgi:membrane protein YdbS with pleckstrin-like domain
VVAQDKSDFNSLIGSIASVIFIVIFVIILLVLGGVLKRPGVGIPGFLILFIILVIALFIVPMFVPYPHYLEIPENFKIAPLPSYAAQAFQMLGLPSEWMYVPAIIYLFILPFAAIYTLVWAFLQSLGIFTNVPSSVNRVLAFIITFLTIPMGWFVKLVWVLFSFMGAWSVVIFVATFLLGVFFRGLTIPRRELEEYKKFVLRSKKESQEITKELEVAKQGTLDVMKKAITENLDKVKALDEKAHRILSAALLSDDPEEVKKLISEAIDRLKK